MKKLLPLLAAISVTTGCSVSDGGEFWLAGDHNPAGVPGYDVSPSQINISLRPAALKNCEGTATGIIDGNDLGSFSFDDSNQALLEVSYPDTSFQVDVVCDDDIDLISLKGLYNHYQGVNQVVQVSPFSTLASGYYDFFNTSSDITGIESVFIGSSNTALGSFFDVSPVDLEFKQYSFPTDYISDDFMMSLINESILEMPMHLDNGAAQSNKNMSEVLTKMTSDISTDGKLDGFAISEAGAQDLLFSINGSEYQVNGYTYLNELTKLIAINGSALTSDRGVQSSLFNKVDQISQNRTSLSRNDDIVTLDTEKPTMTTTASRDGSELTILIDAKDDVIVQKVQITIKGQIFDLDKIGEITYGVILDMDVQGLVTADLETTSITVFDFAGNAEHVVNDYRSL